MMTAYKLMELQNSAKKNIPRDNAAYSELFAQDIALYACLCVRPSGWGAGACVYWYSRSSCCRALAPCFSSLLYPFSSLLPLLFPATPASLLSYHPSRRFLSQVSAQVCSYLLYSLSLFMRARRRVCVVQQRRTHARMYVRVYSYLCTAQVDQLVNQKMGLHWDLLSLQDPDDPNNWKCSCTKWNLPTDTDCDYCGQPRPS